MATVDPPKGLSYAPPLLNFDAIGELGNDFYKGAENRRKYDLARAFQGGIPKDANGNPDLKAAVDLLAKGGAHEQIIPFLKEQQDIEERAALKASANPYAGGTTAANALPQAAPSAAARPAFSGAPIQQRAGAPQQPALSSAGTDNEGAQTVRGMATEIFGGRDVGALIPRFAAAFKIDPDAPLSPEQAAALKPVMGKTFDSMGGLTPQRTQTAPAPTQGYQSVLLPSGVDPRQEITKLRAAGQNILANSPKHGEKLAQQYFDRADKIESDNFGETRRTQGNIDRAFGEAQRVHDIAEKKPIAVQPGSQLVNPITGQPIFQSDTGLLDKPTIDAMARQAMSGDTSVFTNLGRGNQGAENVIAVRKRIAELNSGSGETGSEQAMRNAEFFGVKAGQRTLGTRSANIELAATEFKQVLPVVLEASKAVSRTNYPDLNKIIQMFEEKTGDPNIVKFGGGVNTLVNLYARAISPSGQTTVSDKDHARLILNRAWSQGQFDAAVGMMSQEIDAALSSPDKVRDAMRERFLGGQQGAAKPAAGETHGAPAKPANDGWTVKEIK